MCFPYNKTVAMLAVLMLSGCEDQAALRNADNPPSPPAARMTEFGPGTEDATITQHPYMDNRHAINEGKRLYSWFNCTGCHAHGGGGMGPPLMDKQWIYGSEPAQIFASIMEGRPNGMPAFHGKIPEQEVWKIVAYVRSLGGLSKDLPAGASSRPLQEQAESDKREVKTP